METRDDLCKSLVEYCPPHERLQSFVDRYVFRRIIVPKFCCIQKIMPLRTGSSIDFFIGDRFETLDLSTGLPSPFVRCMIRGPRTRSLYSIRIEGEFISFTVRLKATGLYKMLGLPMEMFVNKAIDAEILRHVPFEKISAQIQNAPGISSCISAVEPYLLFLAEKSNLVSPGIEKAAGLLEQAQRLYPIAKLADVSYLSLRQLERNFIKYVGISPKTYFRMQRFLHLLHAKYEDPCQKWGSLAHEFGFYDQMHLVREFRNFLKVRPSSFSFSDFAF